MHCKRVLILRHSLAEPQDVSWAHMLADGPIEAVEDTPVAPSIPPQPGARSTISELASLSPKMRQSAATAGVDVVKTEEAALAMRGGMPGLRVLTTNFVANWNDIQITIDD